MEKYDNLGLVGEGSYGMVLKCRHKDSGQIVAIKKFLESEDDKMVKKIAMREVRMLKQLRHENLVNLIEVFRRKKRLYLVFEFVDHTVLDDLEKCPNGLDENTVRRVLWQVLRGIEFCHLHNIIHRDIKPENILVSKVGIVKLCDFGFARTLAQPGEAYTDYVATRWYRAPELLVGDTKYGRAVDIWAVGCLIIEMLTGEPLFPGDSDIDQLFHIVKCFGDLPQRHRDIFYRNPLFVGMTLPEVRDYEPLNKKFPRLSQLALTFVEQCLKLDADHRPTCSQLLKHEFFLKDNFAQKFAAELKVKLVKEATDNPLSKFHKSHSSEHNKEQDENNRKKKEKKDKEKKQVKEEEKPKRKLPDPEKFPKKSMGEISIPASNSVNSTSKLSPSHQSRTLGQLQLEANENAPGRASPRPGNTPEENGYMPPIKSTGNQVKNTLDVCSSPSGLTPAYVNQVSLSNSESFGPSPVHTGPPGLRSYASSIGNLYFGEVQLLSRAGEKKKSNTTIYKKNSGGTPAHHSSTVNPQPNLHSEKTNLYDKGIDKAKKRKEEKLAAGVVLPEVKGAEANPNKAKGRKNNLVPHITNLDPFQDPGGSNDKERDNENLPRV